MTGTHFRDVCVHGDVVRQCRCAGPKTDHIVPCPPSCATRPPAYTGRHQVEAQVNTVVIEGELVADD